MRPLIVLPVLVACTKGSPPKEKPATNPAPAQTAGIESRDVLARAPETDRAQVKHVLVGWSDLAPAYRGRMDPRAQGRSQAQAATLAADILRDLRAGAAVEDLMARHSEDPGSAKTGSAYEVTPDAPLVPPFKALGLRLHVGEAGVVETRYGYHVIKRVE